MDIISKNTTIFVNDIDGKKHYRTSLSNKGTDGNYQNAYIDVRMPKDTQLENKTKIAITKGFLSFYKTKDGKNVWYLVVQEYKEIGTIKEEPKQEDQYAKFGTQITVEDLDKNMDLPF